MPLTYGTPGGSAREIDITYICAAPKGAQRPYTEGPDYDSSILDEVLAAAPPPGRRRPSHGRPPENY